MADQIAMNYDRQVRPVKGADGKWTNTRADKETRYAHFNNKTASISEKERWAIEILKVALKRAKSPVLACSFGIDSIVALYLTRKALVELGRDPSEIEVVWNDTLNEFPEVRKYAKELTEKWSLRLTVTRPKKPLKKVIDDNGGITDDYFTARKGSRKNGQPLSEKCCNTLKHEPMNRIAREKNYDLNINGLRADESRQRLLAALRDGEYFYSSGAWKSYMCRPILWWTEEDVWEYVERERIPYNDLYRKNLIRKYPENLDSIIANHSDHLKSLGLDIEKLHERQIQTVTRRQAIALEKLGFDLFTPRTGCMMCPIPIRFGYLQWMRLYYPKVYDAMIHNLGYGKALLDLVPDDVKAEIEALTGIDMTAETAADYLKEILEAKPCVFDKFD